MTKHAAARRARALTLIEMMVTTSVVSLLFAAALGSLRTASAPVAEGSVRAQLAVQGQQTLARLERELQSGDFDTAAAAVFPTQADALAGVNGVAPGTAAAPGKGLAVRMRVWTGIGASDPDPVVFSFEPDGDGYRLVRHEVNGVEITLLRGLKDEGADGPYFGMIEASSLEVRFTLRRQVGYDARAQQRLYTEAVFGKHVNLRDLNQ